jgi:hypothetical protein
MSSDGVDELARVSAEIEVARKQLQVLAFSISLIMFCLLRYDSEIRTGPGRLELTRNWSSHCFCIHLRSCISIVSLQSCPTQAEYDIASMEALAKGVALTKRRADLDHIILLP